MVLLCALHPQQEQAFNHTYPRRPRHEWGDKLQKYRPPGASSTAAVSLRDMVRFLWETAALQAYGVLADFLVVCPVKLGWICVLLVFQSSCWLYSIVRSPVAPPAVVVIAAW